MTPLPSELERIIVEFAIKSCILEIPFNHPSALAIISTCVRFKQWSYPCLYHSIKLQFDSQALLLIRTLSVSPEIGSLVHSLAVNTSKFHDQTDDHEDAIIALVNLCFNVEVLALWTVWSPDADISLNLSSRHRLKRLSFEPSEHIVGHASLTSFQHITHLDLCCMGSSEWYPFIPTMKCLTHLALMVTSFDPSDSDIEELPECLESTTLQVCVIFMFTRRDPPSTENHADRLALGLVDPRVVIGLGFECQLSWPYILRSTEEYLDDFISRTSGPDFWEEAEGIIASRRLKG